MSFDTWQDSVHSPSAKSGTTSQHDPSRAFGTMPYAKCEGWLTGGQWIGIYGSWSVWVTYLHNIHPYDNHTNVGIYGSPMERGSP